MAILGINVPNSSKQETPSSSEEIRRVIGTLYYQQFYILQGLTAVYYLLVLVRGLMAPPMDFSWLLQLSTAVILLLIFVTYVMEKQGRINVNNIYLTPIPIGIAMIVNIQCHVIILDDADMLLRSLLAIMAFGVVSMLPWIFWLLILMAGGFYITTAYLMFGSESGLLIGLGVGAMMVSYGGFAVRNNSVREQIRLNFINLRRAEKMEQLANTKDEFIANMSHELRTPLTGLIGMVDLLEEAPLRPEDQHHLQIARTSAETLQVIINDILDLSKLDASKLQLKPERFNLSVLVKEVSAMMAASAKKKGIRFELILPDTAIPPVIGDSIRLRQILLNLIGNAVKFTDTGQVVVKVVLVANFSDEIVLKLSVEDSGIGIAEGDTVRLFDRFEQVDSSSTRTRMGTGLGLAISQELARLMGSEINVDSTIGEGSSFWFSLRLPKAMDGSVVKTPDPILPSSVPQDMLQRSLHVLVAEDNTVNQILIRKLIERSQWSVEFASDGAEALALAEKMPFDVILMDIQMPKMTGDEVIENVRAGSGPNKEAVIIALTANCMPDNISQYYRAGMNGYIAKPIDVEAFYGTIAQHIMAADNKSNAE